jgi:hypothetical protein
VHRLRCFIASLLLVNGLSAAAAVPDSERQALVDLYNSTGGDGWAFNTNWNGPPGTECTWFGIGCSEDGSHVISIYLTAAFAEMTFGLTGGLPSTLRDLTQLESIDVSMNFLTGPIPSLDGMTRLRIFAATNNGLEGPLPSLAGLAALEYFEVDENGISGPFPRLAGLSHLKWFTASWNALSGPVSSLEGLTSLEGLRIGNNKLSGDLPPFPSAVANHGGSEVCPNAFNQTPNPGWDYAAGAPWYSRCRTPDVVFSDGFD